MMRSASSIGGSRWGRILIALGLQAAPEMAAEYGGLSSDAQAQALVSRMGQATTSGSATKDTPYQFEFHLLADDQTINAYALRQGAYVHDSITE